MASEANTLTSGAENPAAPICGFAPPLQDGTIAPEPPWVFQKARSEVRIPSSYRPGIPELSSGLAQLPKFRPQLATLVQQPPSGPQWLHELKFDGYRIACTVQHGKVRLESRRNYDWTAKFPEIVEAARQLPVESVLLDGEVAIVVPSGLTSFQSLQNAFSGAPRDGLTYFAFDLLHLDGRDIASLPLDERKRQCAQLLEQLGAASPIRYSQHFEVDGSALLERACALGAEGIISKRRDQPYRAGRSDGWLKSKCVKREEFIIGGFTEPSGSRTGIGALLLGVYDNGVLRFAGKVGTGPGFTAEYLARVRRELAAIEQPECPFVPPPPGWIGRNGYWVQPVRRGDVVFTEWTDARTLRHPSFQGFHDEGRPTLPERSLAPPVAPSALAEAQPPAARPNPQCPSKRRSDAKARSDTVAGVAISSPARPVYPDLGFDKRDLAQFYADIASWMLPYVSNRPLTLVRCERPVRTSTALRTDCRFLPHEAGWHHWAAPAVRRVQIQELKKLGEYLVVDSAEALVSLIQGDIIEIHAWNSTADRVEHPDRIVLDLDPGDGVEWAQVVAAALQLRDLLSSLGLQSWPKFTGGKGVHVVLPFAPEHGWDEIYALSRRLAEAALERDPSGFTLDFSKKARKHQILIDYKRNYRGAIAVAAYSTRARPNGAVGIPVSWRELGLSRGPDQWTVKNVRARLKSLKSDPWREFWVCRQRLGR